MAYDTSMGMTDTSSNYRNQRRVLSASSIAGDRVVNSAGEDLGKIHEIMIDVSSGRVAYAVLSFGGFLGIGDKLFAIPWSRMRVDEVNRQIILDVDKATLEAATGFDKDNWPDMSDPDWGTQVYSHYGADPYWDDETSLGTGRTVGTTDRTRSRSGETLL